MEVILMNNLEQYVDTDYYKVLGVDRNCTLQDICCQYIYHHTAIETLHSTIIQPCNITTPIKHSASSRRLQKPSTCSSTVPTS